MSEMRVAIIGAGFGGIEVARGLASEPVQVILIDRHNYQLFQPLLYQVATAELAPTDIAEPIRRLVRHQPNIQVMLGEVTEISARDRNIKLADGSKVAYDALVLATGATTNYFGHEEWSEFAPGLKSLSQARVIRSRLLRSFEEAEETGDPSQRQRLMTIAIVGGGSSGVELAGSIAELARHALAKDFHKIDPASATILLLEKGPRILPSFPEKLSGYALHKLGQLGVTVRTNCTVEAISARSINANGETSPVGFVIWTAGAKASSSGRIIGAATDESGRIKTGPDLSVPGFTEVYAIGDVALTRDSSGRPLPGLAQVAKQQGRYLGRALAKKIRSKTPDERFSYRNRGNLVVIGRHAAILDLGWLSVTGPAAWLAWAVVNIYLLAGLQHRLLVAVQWLWRYVTYDRGARMIVEPARHDARDRPC